MEKILNDPIMVKGVVGPLRADCLAYESYHLSKTLRLSMPIFTVCGANDRIATPQVLKTWKHVAKGRIEHTVIPRAGHRIAQECPDEIANMLQISVVMSPILGASKVPSDVSSDVFLEDIHFDMLGA